MIPRTVTIGCFIYDVIETDDPIIVDGHDCKGSIDYRLHKIKIKASDISDQQKEQTLWHEIVHGIIDYRNMDPKTVSPETLVEELSLALYGMMKTNDKLPGQK